MTTYLGKFKTELWRYLRPGLYVASPRFATAQPLTRCGLYTSIPNACISVIKNND